MSRWWVEVASAVKWLDDRIEALSMSDKSHPRLTFNEEATRYGIYEGVREVYDGPFSMATDNMVWNITKDAVRERMIVSTDAAWAVSGPNRPPKPPARGSLPDPMTDAIKAGRWNVDDAQGPMIEGFKKTHGMK